MHWTFLRAGQAFRFCLPDRSSIYQHRGLALKLHLQLALVSRKRGAKKTGPRTELCWTPVPQDRSPGDSFGTIYTFREDDEVEVIEPLEPLL